MDDAKTRSRRQILEVAAELLERKGAQALSVRVLEAPPSLAKLNRRSADDMAIHVEDLVKVLDGIGSNLKRGRYPDKSHSGKIAQMLRKVADELDA